MGQPQTDPVPPLGQPARPQLAPEAHKQRAHEHQVVAQGKGASEKQDRRIARRERSQKREKGPPPGPARLHFSDEEAITPRARSATLTRVRSLLLGALLALSCGGHVTVDSTTLTVGRGGDAILLDPARVNDRDPSEGCVQIFQHPVGYKPGTDARAPPPPPTWGG